MSGWDGERPGAPRHTNLAKDNAKVGIQVGVLHGDAHVYMHDERATPEERFDVAVNYLLGGSPEEARRRITEVISEHRLASAKVAYYWALAVLSGRAITNLDKEDMETLGRAAEMADRYQSGHWWRGSQVIHRLMSALIYQDAEQAGLNEILREFAQLPPHIRLEIEMHLELILHGAVQDYVEDVNAERVREDRMANDREGRVWKFFEPDPAPPVAKEAVPAAPGAKAWVSLVVGGLMAAAGAGLVLPALFAENVGAALLVLLMVGAGGYAAARFGVARAFLRGRLVTMEHEFSGGQRRRFYRPGGDTETRGFGLGISAVVEAIFDNRQPNDPGLRQRWHAETAGVRATLKADLIDLYGYTETRSAAIVWLVRWHANQTARRWRDGTLAGFRGELRVPALARFGFVAGVVLLCGAALLTLVTATAGHVPAVLGAGVLIGFGIRFGARGGTAIHTEKRRYAEDSADFHARWTAEQAAYEAWTAVLRDRPTDVEMGRWLDLDLAYWKRRVMKDYRLSNQDIFAHLVLTEAAAGSLRARDVGGPFRHSEYTVLLFLLTEGGVRQIEAALEFATGSFRNERRTTFRYDAIASVRVAEVSVRYDDGSRRVLSSEEKQHVRPFQDKVLAHQAFELTLLNGQNVQVLVDNIDDVLDRARETAEQLQRLALDNSGVTSALRILEAIAADGREWIALEQRRLRRRMHHGPASIGGFEVLPGPRQPRETHNGHGAHAPYHGGGERPGFY